MNLTCGSKPYCRLYCPPPRVPPPCSPHEPHLWLEAQINHAVCLVQHDVVALVQHCIVLFEAVNQAARRRDNDLAPAAQLGTLEGVDGECGWGEGVRRGWGGGSSFEQLLLPSLLGHYRPPSPHPPICTYFDCLPTLTLPSAIPLCPPPPPPHLLLDGLPPDH